MKTKEVVNKIYKDSKLTQTEFGSRVGISQVRVSQILKNGCKLSTLKKIAEEFDREVEVRLVDNQNQL